MKKIVFIIFGILLITNQIQAQETDSITDPRDGQTYDIVKIGNQWWMAENLAYLPSVSPSSSGTNTDPYYYVYGYQGSSVSEAKATSNYATYGVLYNWPAAMAGASSSSANPSGVQGVCPDDWHLPSDAEWTTLTDYLGGETVAGGKLKETGTTHWISPNTGATNESGFTALPGGYRYLSGIFNWVGSAGYWWSSTEVAAEGAWHQYLSSDETDFLTLGNYKERGISVRCVKNIDTLTTELSGTNTSSIGGNDGSINLTVNGGVSPYTYIWSNDSTSEDISGLIAGVYSVTVTDALDSTVIDSIRIYDTFVDDRDAQVYKAVTIGNQTWMAENLNSTHYADGTPLISGTGAGDITGDYTTKYYFWFDDDSATYFETYGALYTWAAVMNGEASSDNNPSGVQGVCPDNWHVPSDTAWKELEMFLGMSQSEADNTGWRGTDEGGKIKEADTTHWNSPNTGATNSSGFTALPGGYRTFAGFYGSLGSRANFWSSAEKNSDAAWRRNLYYTNSTVSRDSVEKSNGYSVRCVKNINTLVISLIGTDITSIDGTDGAIDLTVSEGLSPYTFSWSNGATTEDISGLSAGVYSVTVTDARDSTATDSIRIYDTFVDERDTQVYRAVTIGDQIWMAENLNSTHYTDGTPLVDGTGVGDITGDYTTKYYFYYNDDSATYSETYGALYTWAAAMNGEASSDDNPSGVGGMPR